jgi:hypothetical protein
MQFSVGDIFCWDNFPDIADQTSKIKPRLFIYLGKTSSFQTPVILYICTTTTQCQHYESGEDRFTNSFIRLPKGEGGLLYDSILDLTMSFYDMELGRIDSCASDIRTIGHLKSDRLRQIYKEIVSSRRISKMQKRDIRDCFSNAGITGLKAP